MTKKEFITNLFREIGLTVLDYQKDFCEVMEQGSRRSMGCLVYHYTDKCKDTYSIKFKSRSYNFLIEDVRKIRAYLMQRGFACTVDLYHTTGYFSNGRDAILIKCETLPWHQTARPMSDEEVIEDALSEEKRYHPVGYLGE